MNKETFWGQWNEFKGKAKEKWGKLTDDDLKRIDGKKDQLVGHIQKKYGYMKDRAEEEVSLWENSFKSENDTHHAHQNTHDNQKSKNKNNW